MKFGEFWKRYKRDVAKLLTTHFALSIFSILCAAPLLTLDYKNASATVNLLCIVATVFVFAFYYYLIRVQLWQLGAKEKLLADGGRLRLRPATGLWLGMLASIPSLLFNIIYIVASFYKDYAAFKQLHTVFSCIELIWDAPALGLHVATGSPFAYVAVTVLPALFAGLAYFLGTKEFSLFGHKKAS